MGDAVALLEASKDKKNETVIKEDAKDKKESDENEENEEEIKEDVVEQNDVDNNVLMQELYVRRQQVSAYMMMESGYNSELFTSITLTNDLLVTLKDILKNMNHLGAKNVMKQMHEKKVEHLESLVLESQKKWSVLISDFQTRGGALNANLNRASLQKTISKMPKDEDVNEEELMKKKEKKRELELYFD